jgi:hypothetical protein
MKKSIILILLSFFITSCKQKEAFESKNTVFPKKTISYFKNEKAEREEIKKLNLKLETHTKFRYEFDQPSNKGIKSLETEYDTFGRVIKIIPYDNFGLPDLVHRLFYSNLGHIKLEKTFYPARTYIIGGDTSMEIERERNSFPYYDRYDSKGNLIERPIIVLGDVLAGKVIFNYDSLGNCLSEITYNSYGKFDHKYTYEYDDKCKMITSYGKYAFKSSYKYFSNGLIQERIDYSSLGDPIYLVKYSYAYHK